MSEQATEHRTPLRRRVAATRLSIGLSMRIERLWPLLAPPVLIVGVFLALAWSGAFRAVPDWLRLGTVALLALLALVSLWRLLRYRAPTGGEVDRRLESANALAHQPISSQDDTLPANADPFARALWEEHRRRMARNVGRLRGAAPVAGMPKRDPWALRTLVPLALVVAFAISLGPGGGSLRDALAPPAREMSATVAARLDAWVTPPSYTGVAPIFLTRGEAAIEPQEAEDATREARTVPAGSVFTARVAEADGAETVTLIGADGAETPLTPTGTEGGDAGTYEVTLETDATIRVTLEGGERAFAFAVTPDAPPTIEWSENESGEAHAVNEQGALTLGYRAGDDYALAGGRAVFEPVGMEDARPLYDAPEMALAMPRGTAAEPKAARTTRDLTEHPFAGMIASVTLEATDRAGQTGRTASRQIELPERPFRNPLALMLLEQRRALALDAGRQDDVAANLDLVLLHAETTIDNTPHYLGLVTARGRVENAWDDDGLRDAVDYLWELARGIEDGALSSAERRLRDAQDALAEALENGASDEELAELMQELREAMQEFMQMLAERAQDMPQQAMPMPDGMMTPQDLERMLDNMEDAARDGRREQAQAMLDELRRMMDQMQAGTPQQGEQQMGEMQQQMQEMGDLLREQQELMDETFRMQNSRPPEGMPDPEQGTDDIPMPRDPQAQQTPRPGQEPQGGQQQPQQSQRPQQRPQQGQQPQDGQQDGQQQQAQRPQAGEPMSPEEFAEAMDQLRQRQEELQERLDQMQEAMEGMGLEPSEDFADAGEAMGDAEGELGEGDAGPAVDDQGRAIEALRNGAQNMMQQMMQAMQGQQPGQQGQGQQPGMQFGGQQPQPGQQGNPFQQGFGQTREDRDPLGRPRATQGPQFGEEIEVPDEIDTQRARRILEAIRERLGRQLTPKLEREYLERLLELR